MRVPASTYRIQFNMHFGFTDALLIVDYLNELGITDLYSSPLLKARRGSMHGYDMTDPTKLNPEIGTEDEFDSLIRMMRDRQMGLLLDIVPNHMAASSDNPWWFDVLEKGEESPYASFFDVNWDSKRVLLPILVTPYREALENEDLKLRTENGRLVVQYYEQTLPVAAGAESLSAGSVDRVLAQQHYRLAFWRQAAESINYRRFFDINDLVGLCIEKNAVFEATHALVLKWIREEKVSGLRIDHIDGLADPRGYLGKLSPTYVVVEKILAANEEMPPDWYAQGTTGYDFLNMVNGVFVDPSGYASLERTYEKHTGSRSTFRETFHERKRLVMEQLFAGEVNLLVQQLAKLAEQDRHARNLTADELRIALVEVIAVLPVYRTYVRDFDISDTDRKRIEEAIAAARGPKPSIAFDFLRRVLLLEPAWYLREQKNEYLRFVMRWQQFTGPVMAKGLEDTASYVHNTLISLNEVGADSNGPETYFGVEQFHRRNQLRQLQFPYTMNATSTHDTKRSEDVRARINVLSELHEEWIGCWRRWRRMNPSRSAPDANEQILIYQSMLGAWPIDPGRLKEFTTKALREAKTHTNWIDVNEDYERRVLSFIDRILGREPFLRSFVEFQKKVAYFGALSSLSQLLLKTTSPGIPDFYQGTDLWDLSLVDPDNRRPVDFRKRIEMLAQLKRAADPAELLQNWSDGRIKMYITWKTLNFRREHEELFLKGQYIPLKTIGARQEHIVAFARRHGDECVVVAAPRLLATLGNKTWDNTRIELPEDAPQRWINILTGQEPDLSAFPYMLLVPEDKFGRE